MSLTEGALLGTYRIESKLGEGGMGAVYRAVDTMLGRDVAVKALRPEIASQPDILDRFRSEAVLLAKLNNPAIAQLYAFFSEGGQFYMVMEYVAGDTFERVIQQQGAMEWQRAFGYMTQILEGIGHAHAAGILHRDLKPANVMLTPAGKIKLMDFGIAQALGGARMTRQGRIIGTLEYLAPERIQGRPADTRSDLYSAGVMLFEMLSGRLPFQSDSEYELLQKQIQEAPPELGNLGVRVPPEVEAAMRKALEKDPEQRYATAEDFSAALTALLPARVAPASGVSAVFPAPVIPAAAAAVAAVAAAPAQTGPAGMVASRPAPDFKAWLAKPVVWMAAAGGLVLVAASIIFATLRHQPGPVTVADSSQPQMYQSQPALKIDSTPVVLAPQPAQQTPAQQAPTSQTPAAQAPPTKDAQPAAPKPSRPAARETAQTPSSPPNATAPAAQPPTQSAPPPAPAPAPGPAPGAPPQAAEQTPVGAPPPPMPAGVAPLPGRPIVRLADARSVFVSGGQGELDGYIREEIQRQIGPRLRLAASMADADIVMRVTLDEPKGKGIANAGRMFGVKDRATVRAIVVDSRTSHVIWQEGAGDHRLIIGAFHGESLKRVAERIVKEFHDSYAR